MQKTKKKLIVVTDSSFGIPFTDPDDALALWYLCSDPSVEILGIITTAGNVPEYFVFRSVTKVLKGLRKTLPIIRQKQGGAFLAAQLKKFPYQVTALSLAPLSVIAQYIKNNTPLWKQLVVMGGVGKVHPFGWPLIREERNFRKDRKATEIVLAQAQPILVTLEHTQQTLWGPAEIARAPRFMKIHLWLYYFLNRIAGRRGFPPHDLIAAKRAVR